MAVNPNWTVYAPIIIIFLVALLGFSAIRRAIAPDGWYQCINQAPYTIPH